MITKTNPTPPIDGKTYELIFQRRPIGPYAHDIFGLLIDYDTADDIYDADEIPVVNFTERLSRALDFAKMLASLVENGVDYHGIAFTEEKYVAPVIAAIKHDLYICIKDMEEEALKKEEMQAENSNYVPDYDEYAEYHHPMPVPGYAKQLDDWVDENKKILELLPSSGRIESLPEPLTKESLEPIIAEIENAYNERLRVKDRAERDMNMDYFLTHVFALGVPAINDVFQDLYDSLVMFHRIALEQVKMHEKGDVYAAKNYIRGKYNRLKDAGKI